MYGHAFRAPSFTETQWPAPGSETDPETTDTYEISLGADLTSSFSGCITFYYKEHEDHIQFTYLSYPIAFYNAPLTERDHGFEIEAKYEFGRGTYLAANYAYISPESSHGFWRQSGKIMSNIRLSRCLNLYTDCLLLDGLVTKVDRDPLPGYGIVNATLIAKKFLKGYNGLELRVSVYNLLDKNYRELAAVPQYWPMPGINFLLEMKYSF
jgi:outer membrane receptor protein involved in Fe transport